MALGKIAWKQLSARQQTHGGHVASVALEHGQDTRCKVIQLMLDYGAGVASEKKSGGEASRMETAPGRRASWMSLELAIYQ